MSPELHKELIVNIVSVTLTALFTGIPALMLWWWTWQRDQERLIVQKLRPRMKTISGENVFLTDDLGPIVNILIRNRSLFSVHISSISFQIDGEEIVLENPYLTLKMKVNPNRNSHFTKIADIDSDPMEIQSQKSTQVELFNPDRDKIATAISNAAKKNRATVDDIIGSHRLVALVTSETGQEFSSLPLSARVKGRLVRGLRNPFSIF